MNIMVVFIAVILVMIIEYLLVKKKNSRDEEDHDNYGKNYHDEYPFHSKYLLTKNEYYFYNKLKAVTEPLNLQILAKIRLADLIEINDDIKGKEWWALFGKIKSKHIDFAISDNMRIVALIELDDYSHQRSDRQKRDEFVNNALSTAGYNVIRTYGDTNVIKQTLSDLGYDQLESAGAEYDE